MYLLSLFVLFMLAGWILATSRFSQSIDEATGSVAARIRGFGAALRRRWQALFGRGRSPRRDDDFRRYALSVGAPLFPADFKTWLAALPADEARSFQRSLSEYGDSLGLRLVELVDGSLDHDPIMRQVFVEAIVVYSPAYRKARQAKKEAAEAENNNGAHTADPEIQTAQKSPSRRKQPAAEEAETAAASS